MNKYREILDYAKQRGLRIEVGSKHTKLYTQYGQMILILSPNNSGGPKWSIFDQKRMLDKQIKKAGT